MGEEPKLTLKQERFVEVMASQEPPSLTEAARLAGYEDNGNGAIRVAAHRAITNDNVQAAIQSRRESLAERAGIDPVTVLQRIETRANSAEVPHTVRQRADETLLDVLNLKDQAAGAIDARSLTVNASSEDVHDLLRLILGDS